jgi:DNA-binding transcriptional LysR family regulator
LIFRSVAARDMAGLLEQGDLDFGLIIDDPLEDPHLEVESLCAEPLVLLTNPQHPLAACAEVFPNQLRSQTLLLTDSGCTYCAKFLKSLE